MTVLSVTAVIANAVLYVMFANAECVEKNAKKNGGSAQGPGTGDPGYPASVFFRVFFVT